MRSPHPETVCASQDVARLLMLGGALAQMPAWYVELSYAQALEACALLARQPLSATCRLLQQGVCIFAPLFHMRHPRRPALSLHSC